MIKYGAGVLSPADLISVVIGGKNADTVIEAGNVLGIKLVDHVIVSDTDYKSLRFSEMYNLEF